ncbi:MAG TPA: ATP-binding protein [Actinomycetota bacterium]|nr:ATP-binding protein [Actinomycetota bacterium]
MAAAPVFSIDFPAEADYVSTARIFCGAVARHYGCDPADIEDLKIALSEACGSAISHARSQEPLRVQASPDGGLLTFEVNGHRRRELQNRAAASAEDTDQHMLALSAELIAALFPDAEFVDTPEGTFFRISVLAGSAGS